MLHGREVGFEPLGDERAHVSGEGDRKGEVILESAPLRPRDVLLESHIFARLLKYSVDDYRAIQLRRLGWWLGRQ